MAAAGDETGSKRIRETAPSFTGPSTTLTSGTQEQSDPQVLRNLNRSVNPMPKITEGQKAGLRARKTPALDAFKAEGMGIFAPKNKVAPREDKPLEAAA